VGVSGDVSVLAGGLISIEHQIPIVAEALVVTRVSGASLAPPGGLDFAEGLGHPVHHISLEALAVHWILVDTLPPAGNPVFAEVLSLASAPAEWKAPFEALVVRRVSLEAAGPPANLAFSDARDSAFGSSPAQAPAPAAREASFEILVVDLAFADVCDSAPVLVARKARVEALIAIRVSVVDLDSVETASLARAPA
jgi:hypothetical protein